MAKKGYSSTIFLDFVPLRGRLNNEICENRTAFMPSLGISILMKFSRTVNGDFGISIDCLCRLVPEEEKHQTCKYCCKLKGKNCAIPYGFDLAPEDDPIDIRLGFYSITWNLLEYNKE